MTHPALVAYNRHHGRPLTASAPEPENTTWESWRLAWAASRADTAHPALFTDRWAAGLAADVKNAAHSISLTALSFLPPRASQHGDMATLCAHLAAAAACRIDVHLTIPHPTTAHPATLRNADAAEWCKDRGISCTLKPMPNLLHAKTALIDDRILWIGSGNLTQAAATHNREAWLRVEDRALAVQLAVFHQGLK